MSAVHRTNRARFVSIAVLSAMWLGVSVGPASAEQTAAARSHETAKRAATSLNLNTAGSVAPTTLAPHSGNILNGFVYNTGPQSVGFRGRVNVGKTRVYVPYYGNVDADPLHPNAEGFAGIGYGFRTWDISVVNGGYSGAAANVPGADTPKATQSLSFSIHF
jgi:hypothetical protein